MGAPARGVRRRGGLIRRRAADGRALLTWLARRAGRGAIPAWGTLPPPAARHDRLVDAVAAHLDLAAAARLVRLAL